MKASDFTETQNPARSSLSMLWHAVRIPTHTLLDLFEPFVSVVLGAIAILGIATALLGKAFGFAHFHFWLILGASIAIGILRRLYLGLINRLS